MNEIWMVLLALQGGFNLVLLLMVARLARRVGPVREPARAAAAAVAEAAVPPGPAPRVTARSRAPRKGLRTPRKSSVPPHLERMLDDTPHRSTLAASNSPSGSPWERLPSGEEALSKTMGALRRRARTAGVVS
ncbi:MAG: hypothetical protein ACE5IK_04610 [Acidobacteriota bacterium]